ncbi:MAG: hypothetical protein AB1642_08735 [Pseudomonadota bacterium]
MKPYLLLPLLALLLTACVQEPAGFLIEGGNHSLTVERNKPYFWSSGWELDLIVARYPECQRRHAMRKVAGEKVSVHLFRTQSGAFILNQGKNWYVAETLGCQMQRYEEEPPEPGEYLGSFRVKNDVFGFVPNAEDGKGKGGDE